MFECMHVCIPTYLPTYLPTYIHTNMLAGGIDNDNEAFSSEVVEALRLLRDAGVDLKLPAVLSCEGEVLQKTLVHQVVHFGHGVEVLHFLSISGANLDMRDQFDYTPLFDAVVYNHASIGPNQAALLLALMQALLQLGADLQAKLKNGDGLLHCACRYGNHEVVQQLLRLGMAPNDVSTSGRTPLLCASKAGHLTVVQLLHQWGANLNFADFSGRSAFSLAIRERHESIVSFLRSCGACEHVGSGRTSLRTQTDWLFKKGKTLPQARNEKPPSRHKRTTPMRERAERAEVLDRYKETPPGLRERAESGSRSAKKELTAIHKHNHKVVDRAEVAARADTYEHDRRLQKDAQAHGKRKLEKSFASATV